MEPVAPRNSIAEMTDTVFCFSVFWVKPRTLSGSDEQELSKMTRWVSLISSPETI